MTSIRIKRKRYLFFFPLTEKKPFILLKDRWYYHLSSPPLFVLRVCLSTNKLICCL